MDIGLPVFYLTVICIASFSLYASFLLYKKHKLESLKYIHYFILISIIFALFNWIGPEITSGLIKPDPEHNDRFLVFLLKTLGFPFLIFKLYILFLLSQQFSQKPYPSFAKPLVLILLTVLLIIHPITSILSVKSSLSGIMLFYKIIEGNLLVLFQYILILMILFPARHYPRENMKYIGWIFGKWYFIGFSIAVAVMNLKLGLTLGYYLSIFLFFSILVPPILFIHHFLKQSAARNPNLHSDSFKLDQFSHEYKLSAREREILALILENKSNKEIEDLQYISMQTVKNNISRIYRKVDVNNRHHLIRTFANYMKQD